MLFTLVSHGLESFLPFQDGALELKTNSESASHLKKPSRGATHGEYQCYITFNCSTPGILPSLSANNAESTEPDVVL